MDWEFFRNLISQLRGGCCGGCFHCAAVLSVKFCLPRSLLFPVSVSVSLSNAKIPLLFCWLSFHFPARLSPRPASCLFRFAVYFRNFIIAFGWVATVWLFALCLWGPGQRVVLATWPGHLVGILEWDSKRKQAYPWGIDCWLEDGNPGSCSRLLATLSGHRESGLGKELALPIQTLRYLCLVGNYTNLLSCI